MSRIVRRIAAASAAMMFSAGLGPAAGRAEPESPRPLRIEAEVSPRQTETSVETCDRDGMLRSAYDRLHTLDRSFLAFVTEDDPFLRAVAERLAGEVAEAGWFASAESAAVGPDGPIGPRLRPSVFCHVLRVGDGIDDPAASYMERRLRAGVRLVVGNSPFEDEPHVVNGVTPERVAHYSTTFEVRHESAWGPEKDCCGADEGTPERRAEYAAGRISEHAVGAIAQALEPKRLKGYRMKTVPASFDTPYAPPPEFAFLEAFGAERLASFHGAGTRCDAIWTFASDTGRREVYAEIAKELNRLGWPDAADEVRAARFTEDRRGGEAIFFNGLGRERLRVASYDRVRGSGDLAEGRYYLRYRRHASDEQFGHFAADLVASGSDLKTADIFREHFTPETEELFVTRLLAEKPYETKCWATAAWIADRRLAGPLREAERDLWRRRAVHARVGASRFLRDWYLDPFTGGRTWRSTAIAIAARGWDAERLAAFPAVRDYLESKNVALLGDFAAPDNPDAYETCRELRFESEWVDRRDGDDAWFAVRTPDGSSAVIGVRDNPDRDRGYYREHYFKSPTAGPQRYYYEGRCYCPTNDGVATTSCDGYFGPYRGKLKFFYDLGDGGTIERVKLIADLRAFDQPYRLPRR